MALFAVLMCVNFASCSEGDDEPEAESNKKDEVVEKIELTQFKRLKDFISADEAPTITELTIHGIVQGADIDYMLRMLENGKLGIIDMSDTQLVSTSDNVYWRIDGEKGKLWCDDTVIEYMFTDAKKLTEIRLPNNLESVESYVFRNCENLKSITIGKSTKHVAVDFVDNCSKLEAIYVLAETPPSAGGLKPDRKYTIYVPKGCASKYSESKYWNYFEIKEMD